MLPIFKARQASGRNATKLTGIEQVEGNTVQVAENTTQTDENTAPSHDFVYRITPKRLIEKMKGDHGDPPS